MPSDVERARAELAQADRESARLQQELDALWRTLDPARPVATPAELYLMERLSSWIAKRYAAEHALFRAEHGTPTIVGSHGGYQWLTSVDHTITDLLRLCPAVL